MPPLSLTQSKYAFAASVMSVKSIPGIFVTIAPTLIGVPVAFLPVAMPHFASVGVGPSCLLGRTAATAARRAAVVTPAARQHERQRRDHRHQPQRHQ